MLKLAVKYRLYPTKAQETFLRQTLAICCDVYNSMVHWRKYDYQEHGKSPSYYEQKKALSVWKQNHPELCQPNAQMLQDVAHRVELAFVAFFRRCRKDKDDEAPGYPRFKGVGQYNSLTYTEDRCYKVKLNRVWVSKIGDVKAVVHRPLPGKPKTCTIRIRAGKWFACITCEVEAKPLAPSDNKVGIDVGLQHFAATNEGEFVPNPRFFRKEEKALAKAQRKFDKVKHAQTVEAKAQRRKTKKVFARTHERIRNRRHNFVHQTARKIVNRFGLIAVEKLNVKNMSKRPKPKQDAETGEYLPNGASQKAGLNKSIADVAWGMFRRVLSEKAESAGRQLMEVNPAYTSQDCSGCGYRPSKDGRKKLSDRRHFCPRCRLSLDRDTNAARNILKIGMGQHTVSG